MASGGEGLASGSGLTSLSPVLGALKTASGRDCGGFRPALTAGGV